MEALLFPSYFPRLPFSLFLRPCSQCPPGRLDSTLTGTERNLAVGVYALADGSPGAPWRLVCAAVKMKDIRSLRQAVDERIRQ